MAEYIKREAAMQAFLAEKPDAHYPGWYAGLLEELPAADVAPVVHGRWVPFRSEAAGDIQYCSACEIGFGAKTDYCPNCGARMDGDAE